MKVERFIADDMRQAMKSVRDSLGEQALIISNRRVNGQTEIIAALESKAAGPVPAAGIEMAARETAPTAVAESEQVTPIKKTSGREEPSLSEIKKELSRLRKMFEGELSQLSWREMGIRQPNKAAIQKRLESAGLNASVSNMISDKVMPCDDLDEGWKNALKATARLITIPEQSFMEEGGLVALLGSTGVGKTVTAAKIAAQFAARHGDNEVALVSTDNLRTGGKEQLLSFGSALGIAVQFASSRESLEKTLLSLSHKKLIIIDSAGISRLDRELPLRLEEIMLPDRRIHACLVLSATTQEKIVNESIKAFTGANLQSAIITHTDECGSLGPVLSNLIRYRLPLTLVGTGPNVPSDLQKPDSRFLLSNLVSSYREAVRENKPKGKTTAVRRVANG